MLSKFINTGVSFSWSVAFGIRLICKIKISAIFLNWTFPGFIGISSFLHFGQYRLLLTKILLSMKWLLKELYHKLRDHYRKILLRKNERYQAFASFSWRFKPFFVKLLLDSFCFLSLLRKFQFHKVNLMIEILFTITHHTLVIET